MSAGNRPALRIGLTGGIGSGKSTVATLLAQCGAVLFDADAVSRELTGPGGQAMPAITAAFGPQMARADGSLDRAAMRQAVFQDPALRRRLEGILHPLIGQRREQTLQGATGRTVVLDIPLLAESPDWRARVDRIVVVDCLEETQVARVGARSGLQAEEVRRIMASQASRLQRRAIADAVIHNEGIDPLQLGQQVRHLWAHWQSQLRPDGTA